MMSRVRMIQWTNGIHVVQFDAVCCHGPLLDTYWQDADTLEVWAVKYIHHIFHNQFPLPFGGSLGADLAGPVLFPPRVPLPPPLQEERAARNQRLVKRKFKFKCKLSELTHDDCSFLSTFSTFSLTSHQLSSFFSPLNIYEENGPCRHGTV
jgi:hypothetical protein